MLDPLVISCPSLSVKIHPNPAAFVSDIHAASVLQYIAEEGISIAGVCEVDGVSTDLLPHVPLPIPLRPEAPLIRSIEWRSIYSRKLGGYLQSRGSKLTRGRDW